MKGKSIFVRIMLDIRGATAVEYGLLVGLISMAAIFGMGGFAGEVESLWHRIETGLR